MPSHLCHSGQSGGQKWLHQKGLDVQENHPDCCGVDQPDLVLGCGDYVKPNPTLPFQPAQSADSTFQSDYSKESVKPKSLCLTPRVSAIKDKASLRQW